MIRLVLLVLLIIDLPFQISPNDQFEDYTSKEEQPRTTINQTTEQPKVETLGKLFKQQVDQLKTAEKLDIIFLVDASSSVGNENFLSELRFVKKLLSDVTVDLDHTRIAVVTFSSQDLIIRNIDEISVVREENNKCLLLNKQLNSIEYTGGGTYTLGALQKAKVIFESSRNDSKKAIFLITDGFSNGGDPVPVSEELKHDGVTIFTIGIQNGNIEELYEIASPPSDHHCYLLDSFEEFESLARRALHVDLKSGDYIPLAVTSPCDDLCAGGNCCDQFALCSCGTATGHYACICHPGYYGSGLRNSCEVCPQGTYYDGPNSCLPCPDMQHTTTPPAFGIEDCKCKKGYHQDTLTHQCDVLKCPKFKKPAHGYFVRKKDCGRVLNSACGVRCEVGYSLLGTSIRICQDDGSWSGNTPSCQVKTCPKLPSPPHGRIVCAHQDLGVKYNNSEENLPVDTTCQFECDPGRTLIGSKSRTCLPIARWDGLKTSCKQIKCKKLLPIQFGQITPSSCTTNKQPFGGNCTIECDDGFRLIGPSRVSCTGYHGSWVGSDGSGPVYKCIDETPPEISCPSNITTSTMTGSKFAVLNWDAPDVTDNSGSGNIKTWMKPASMFNTSSLIYEIGETAVTYYAQDGFQNKAQCTFYVTIVDHEPPMIENCIDPPTFLTADRAGANVTWNEPGISDNSGDVLQVVKSHDFGFFPLGTTAVTYKAVDKFNNTNICNINITIEASRYYTRLLGHPVEVGGGHEGHAQYTRTPYPSVERRQNLNTTRAAPLCLSAQCSELMERKPPLNKRRRARCCQINTQQAFQISCVSISSLDVIWRLMNAWTFVVRSMDVWAVVWEAHCEALPDPIYGTSDCSPQLNGIHCIITCEDGYAIPLERPDMSPEKVSFICEDAQPEWYNQDGLAFPECAVTKLPEEAVHDVDVKIGVQEDICGDSDAFKEFENELKLVLLQDSCRSNCSIETLSCDDENKYKIKRSIERKRSSRRDLTVRVRGLQINTTESLLDNRLLNKYGNVTIINRGTAINITCPSGFVPRRNICVECPRGTYQDLATCRSCDFGTFNNKTGKTACVPCPAHHSTSKMRSRFAADCKEQCRPGTYARKRAVKSKRHSRVLERATLQPFCRSCPLGQYQPDYGVTNCIDCPVNQTTLSFGSSNLNDCLPTSRAICALKDNTCVHGSCVISDTIFGYTCECEAGFYGTFCEREISLCDSNPCMNGATCTVLNGEYKNDLHCICPAGFTGKHCEEFDRSCPISCSNGGECVQDEDDENICLCKAGFGGDLCEVKLSYCSESICENNGTCIENDDGFSCQCRNGYIGRRCNILPCDYLPCHPNMICFNILEDNSTRDSYSCKCPDGYEGEACDKKIDYCESEPCLNGGECVSEEVNFKCVCSFLFNGSRCEHEKNHNYVLTFERSSTNSYVLLEGFKDNLTEISTCFWLQTTDSFNYGTLVSYATRRYDNAFSITDYSGIVFYVNNKNVVTDIILNDGLWHHLCVTWTRLNGNYWVYLDGRAVKTGQDLSPEEDIEGNGSMIIGQEQDAFGGRFSQSESFIGKISYFDVWDRVLTDAEIKKHHESCNDLLFGNLYNWPSLQDRILGEIKIEKSSFCESCGALRSLLNGQINITGNRAFYECNQGFSLKNGYPDGRMCTKASSWEGDIEPYCQRVYCGYPGGTPNGYVRGRSYYYGDRVSYGCYEGFDLEGSSSIICQEDGAWSKKPLCSARQCASFEPQDPEFKYKIITETFGDDVITPEASRFNVGTQVEISCDDESQLVGPKVVTCLETGAWDVTEFPKCVKTATELQMVEMETTDLVVEVTTRRLECALMDLPEAPENGFIDQLSLQAFKEGLSRIVSYRCEAGYRLRGDAGTTCILDGYWTEPGSSCEAIQCRRPRPLRTMSFLETRQRNYTYGDTLTLKCSEGYDLYGSRVIYCLANGRWSRIQGMCVRKSCGKPPLKEQTTIKGSSYLFDETVTLICPDQLEYELRCNENGEWEGGKGESC